MCKNAKEHTLARYNFPELAQCNFRRLHRHSSLPSREVRQHKELCGVAHLIESCCVRLHKLTHAAVVAAYSQPREGAVCGERPLNHDLSGEDEVSKIVNRTFNSAASAASVRAGFAANEDN